MVENAMQDTALPEIEQRTAHATPDQASRARGRTAEPVIRREGITWTGGAAGAPLRLALTFENPLPVATVATVAHVRYAEYGAFLPWRPLTQVAVPPLPPGGRTLVTATAALPPVRPSTAFPRLPSIAFLRWLRRRLTSSTPARLGALPAANIDVRIGARTPVERHFGTFACLVPGRPNHAFFKVGDGHLHEYVVQMEACPDDWNVEMFLHDRVADTGSLRKGLSLRLSFAMAVADILPPDAATSGYLAFRFDRPATGHTATVELSLAADGAAPSDRAR